MCIAVSRTRLMGIKETSQSASQSNQHTIQNMTAMSSCNRTNTKRNKESEHRARESEEKVTTSSINTKHTAQCTIHDQHGFSLTLSFSLALALCMCLYECLFIIYLVWFHTHSFVRLLATLYRCSNGVSETKRFTYI